MKKGAALLIIVLLIAIFGAVVTTMTRAGLLNGIFTNNTVDAMIAEEASQAGLEIALLELKNDPTIITEKCFDLENNDNDCSGLTRADRYVKYKIEEYKGSNSPLRKIISKGYYGAAVKVRELTQELEVGT